MQQATPHWSAGYIGQSYELTNCAALAAQVQREIFGHEVTLPEQLATSYRDIARQFDQFQCVVADPIDTPSEGDAVLMKCRGWLSHVGVYCLINNQPYVLHAMRNAGQVVMHRLCDLKNLGLTVEGYFRWR